jgi:KDO2-lipid IV(A) lauroyltransferase
VQFAPGHENARPPEAASATVEPAARPATLFDRAEVWVLAAVRAAAGLLPIDLVSWTGGLIASAGSRYTRRNKRVMSNLAVAFPDLSEGERAGIARAMWRNYGRTVAESFIIDRIAADPGRIELADEASVRTLLSGTRGAVFVGLHFGNWEVTIVPALRVGQQPVGIFNPLKNPEANSFLLKLRRGLYPGGLLPASRATVLKVARHVRNGGSVCMLADHRDRTGIAVPFFGRPAPSTTLPALLSVSYGSRLFAARVDRLSGARFRVHLEEIAVSRTGDKEADVQRTTAAIQETFETWIRARPASWLWCYKRWDTVRPRTGARAAKAPQITEQPINRG